MAKRAKKPTARQLKHIVEELRPLAKPIDWPQLDPQNANEHTDEGLALVGASVEEFQQLKPIVVDQKTNYVLAGNGTLKAMRAAGFQYVAAVVKEFTPAEARKFGIIDNRSNRMSEFNTETLIAQIDELTQQGIESVDVGYDPDDLADLMQSVADDIITDKPATPKKQKRPRAKRYQILIECDNKRDQRDKLAELTQMEYRCKALSEAE